MIHITQNTQKMGDIPSVSLDPWIECQHAAPCRVSCYARTLCKRRPTVHRAWNRNSEMVQKDLPEYFAQLNRWLRWNRPRYFRFHVGGDIPNAAYFDEMILTAQLNGDTKFLVFTKKHNLVDFDRAPDNLSIMLSMWPGWGNEHLTRRNGRIAWYHDRTHPEPRIPARHHKCPGHCYECGHYCWRTDADKLDVVFSPKTRDVK